MLISFSFLLLTYLFRKRKCSQFQLKTLFSLLRYAFFHANRKAFSNVKTSTGQVWTPSFHNASVPEIKPDRVRMFHYNTVNLNNLHMNQLFYIKFTCQKMIVFGWQSKFELFDK